MTDTKLKTTEEIADALLEQGFTIIPLGSPTEDIPADIIKKRYGGDKEKAQQSWPKAPLINWKQYQDKEPTNGEIDGWIKRWPYANYGIITGKNVVVVDADSKEAVEFMESVQVHQTPWKVKTAKGKHYYFQYDNSVEIRNSANTTTKIDIRGEGGYVVAPGSVHYTGVVYEWEIDATNPINSIHDLPYLSRDDIAAIRGFNTEDKPVGNFGFTASAYASTKHDGSPVEEGGRNNAAASMAGQYITAGYDLKTVTELVAQWNHTNAAPLENQEINTTVASVALTHLRNNPGSVIPLEREKPEPQQPTIEVQDAMPNHLYKVPGALGELVDYANDTAVKKQPALAVQTALALGSLVCGRIYRTNKNNFSSMYYLNIAKSSSGKEHGKTVIEAVLDASGYGNLMGGSGYTSIGAIFTELMSKPNHITIIDEFGKYLESSKGKNNTHKDEVITKLVESWSRCHGVMRPPTYSAMSAKKGQAEEEVERIVYSPAVSLLAMTTPGTFYHNLTPELVRDGFLGRFLVMESELGRQPSEDPDVQQVPESLIEWVKAVRTARIGNFAEYKLASDPVNPIVLYFEDDALELLKDFEKEIMPAQNKLDERGLDVLLGRTREKAMRLALVLALSENPLAETISAKVTQWAIDYVRYLDYRLVDIVIKRVGGSEYETQLKACLEVLRKAGPKGLTEYEMGRRPVFSKLKPHQLEEIKKAWTTRGIAQYVANVNKQGRPRAAWVCLAN